MSAGNCIEPWLSHLRFGELVGGRRDDLGGARWCLRRCARHFTTAASRCTADDLGGLSCDVRGATAHWARRDPTKQILAAVVVDDAVGDVADDVEVELAGQSATDDPVVGSALARALNIWAMGMPPSKVTFASYSWPLWNTASNSDLAREPYK